MKPVLWARGILQPIAERRNRTPEIAEAVRLDEEVKVTHAGRQTADRRRQS